MRTIYCLELENARLFVFLRDTPSSHPIELFLEAVLSFEYVRQNKPLSIKDIWPETHSLDLDHRVKQHMLLYGIDHVRGGSYSNPELTPEQHALLTVELQGPTQVFPSHVIKDILANCVQGANEERAQILEKRARFQSECAVLADLRRLDIPKARTELDWLLTFCENSVAPHASPVPVRLDGLIKAPIIARYRKIVKILHDIYSFMTRWGRGGTGILLQYPQFLLDDFFYGAWNPITKTKVENVRQLCEAYQTFVTTWENRLAEAEFDVASWDPYTEARCSCSLTLIDLCMVR
jgi:hypothetical protein